jgi:hypothetical protein
MVTEGILPFKENSHGRADNRTRDLMFSGQRLWPLDHETGHILLIKWQDSGNWKTKRYVALFGELALVKVMDVSSNRQ